MLSLDNFYWMICMKKESIKVMWIVLILTNVLVSSLFYFKYQEVLRQQAEESAVNLIGLIRLRQVVPQGVTILRDKVDILLYGKLVQTELYWPNYKIEMRQRLAREFSKLKSVWLLEPPQQVSDESLNFLSEVCKPDSDCPHGVLKSKFNGN